MRSGRAPEPTTDPDKRTHWYRSFMPAKSTGPAAIFGIRIKSIFIVLVFLAVLLTVLNWSEISSLLDSAGNLAEDSHEQPKNENGPDIVVDKAMLSKAIQEVQTEKLEEMETSDGSIPTDRFFYIVELVSGGDLEGVDLTIEPDQVILVSEGGTSTTINRTDVKKIHRHKLPPSPKE